MNKNTGLDAKKRLRISKRRRQLCWEAQQLPGVDHEILRAMDMGKIPGIHYRMVLDMVAAALDPVWGAEHFSQASWGSQQRYLNMEDI